MSSLFAPTRFLSTIILVTSSISFALFLSACRNEISIDRPGNDLEIRTPQTPTTPGEPGIGPGPGTVAANPEPEGPTGEPDVVTDPEPAVPTMMESTKNDLIWKRYRAVERDLMRGLDLQRSEVCNELGRFACVDVVHLAPLGGNEPFEQSQYQPVSEPTATTAIAFARTVLAACSKRVDLDKTGSPEVFENIDLNATSLNPDDAAVAAQIDADMTTLYRNLLSRNPEPRELELLRGLARTDDAGPMTAADFAKASCLAVGSSVEALFF